MKNIYFTCIFILIAFVLQSCGHGDFSENALTQIELPAGTAVMVNRGDSLIPTSGSTRIRVTHVYENGTRSVEVLTGSARLLKGNYVPTGS